eukprot:1178370-Prorocentrum_minimum.AAC.12
MTEEPHLAHVHAGGEREAGGGLHGHAPLEDARLVLGTGEGALEGAARHVRGEGPGGRPHRARVQHACDLQLLRVIFVPVFRF